MDKEITVRGIPSRRQMFVVIFVPQPIETLELLSHGCHASA